MIEPVGAELVYSKVDEIIDRYKEEKTPLMAILEDISQVYGYLLRIFLNEYPIRQVSLLVKFTEWLLFILF